MKREDKIGLTLAYIGLLVITLICLASAETMYSGETKIIEFSDLVKDCEILNNQFDLEGLNFTEFENTVIIETNPFYKPDNFTISCLVRGFKEEQSPSGSGSSSSSNVPLQPYVDNIDDLRKELLLKQLLEKQAQENQTLIEPIEPVDDTDESEDKPNWIWILITIIIVIALIFVYLMWKGIKENQEIYIDAEDTQNDI